MSSSDRIIDKLDRRLTKYEKEARAKAQAKQARKYKQMTLWNEPSDGVDPK